MEIEIERLDQKLRDKIGNNAQIWVKIWDEEFWLSQDEFNELKDKINSFEKTTLEK